MVSYINIIRFFLLAILGAVMCAPGHSQVNIKVGYTPAWGNFDVINQNLKEYNNLNADILESEFGELHFLHGLDVGLRYKVKNIGFEMSWANLARRRSSLSYFSQSDSFDSREYKFGLNSCSLGVDTYFDIIGFGAAIHSQRLKIEREIGTNELALSSDRNWNMDVHLNIRMNKDEAMKIILRPFYRFSLASYDIGRFTQELNGSTDIDTGLAFYGLSIIFFNGPS